MITPTPAPSGNSPGGEAYELVPSRAVEQAVQTALAWHSWQENQTGSLLFGIGPNADAGLTGSIVLNQSQDGEPPDEEVDRHLGSLTDAAELQREASARELGRLQATRAVQPLAALVTDDPCPAVRTAAVRALGLIGTRSCRALSALTALRTAAEHDSDPKVRHNAEFALEIIELAERKGTLP
jgi:hypothetical protein